MNVLLDLRCLDTASARRGIGRYASQLALALLKEAPPDWRFSGLSYGGAGRALGLADLRCPGPRRGIGWTDRFVLPPLFDKHSIDLFHSTAYALPARRELRPAMVLTIHDLVPELFPEAVSFRHRLAFRRTFRSAARAGRVITVSESTRRDLIARYAVDPARVEVVHNGVAAAFHESGVAGRSCAWPTPFLLYVGGLDPLKNVAFLLRVLAEARRRFPDLRLVIVGEEGPRRDALSAVATRADLAAAVQFEGFVDDATLAAAYRAAAAFVFPSRYEGFGLPPLEAMSAGCPVISSPGGALAETLEGAALLRAPDDVAGWVEGVAALLGDAALRRRTIEAGMERAAGFTWLAAARRTVAVYADAAREAAA